MSNHIWLIIYGLSTQWVCTTSPNLVLARTYPPGHINGVYMSWRTVHQDIYVARTYKCRICAPRHIHALQEIVIRTYTALQDISPRHSGQDTLYSRTYTISIDTTRTYTMSPGHIRETQPGHLPLYVLAIIVYVLEHRYPDGHVLTDMS